MSEQKVESGRIADGAVLGNKIASNAVRGNNIVAGTITGNLIASGAISGNNIVENSIRGNNIVAGTITGNLLASQTITGDDLAANIIRANNIVAGQVSSNTLSPDLKISLTQVFETGNVFTTAVGGNVNIDLQNNVLYFFSSNTTANVTFNFRANTQNTLDSQLNIGQTVTSAILLKQGATRYRANVYIDGVLQSPWWLNNSAPGFATTQQESIDLYSFSLFKTAANVYTVLASNSSFQLARNQNP
jgi:cytoskeletal protein CcmA (bactofilin family)